MSKSISIQAGNKINLAQLKNEFKANLQSLHLRCKKRICGDNSVRLSWRKNTAYRCFIRIL